MPAEPAEPSGAVAQGCFYSIDRMSLLFLEMHMGASMTGLRHSLANHAAARNNVQKLAREQ